MERPFVHTSVSVAGGRGKVVAVVGGQSLPPVRFGGYQALARTEGKRMDGVAYSIDGRNSGMHHAHVSDNEHDTSTRYEGTTQMYETYSPPIVCDTLASSPVKHDAT